MPEKTLSFGRPELEALLAKPDHTPKDLLKLLGYDFGDIYSQGTGVWGAIPCDGIR